MTTKGHAGSEVISDSDTMIDWNPRMGIQYTKTVKHNLKNLFTC